MESKSGIYTDFKIKTNEFRENEIDLNELEPFINGPFTPDLATPISMMKEVAFKNNSLRVSNSCQNFSRRI